MCFTKRMLPRVARWLRIGLTCSLLWASGAAALTPVARAEVCSYATNPVALARASAPAPSERTPRSQFSQRRSQQQAPGTRALAARPSRARPNALRLPRAQRLYLRNCVLVR